MAPDLDILGTGRTGPDPSYLTRCQIPVAAPRGGCDGVRDLRPGIHAAVPPRQRSRGRAPRVDERARAREGRRRRRLQVRVGDRAPLPRRVLAPLRQRRVPRLPRALHRAHPPRLGHLQPAAAGEPPGQGGREGRDARPPLRRALRVRHRPRRGQPRDPRLPPRHEGPVGHARHLGGRDRASSRRCGCRTTTRATRASTGRCRRARSCPSPT